MRLSRANIPLASEDRTHSQAISTYPHNNLAPHFLPGFINLQHFCHSRWRNPVRLSKSGITGRHRVTGGGRPPPVPTERSVQISRTTLFRRWFTALRDLVNPRL